MGDDPADDIDVRETVERPREATLDERVTPRPSRPERERLPSLRAGQAFGGYRLVRILGEGGFGQVWEAEAAGSGRRVALKVVTRELNDEGRQRFEREGRLAASLNHPHCVYVLAAESIDGHPAIAMELMPGGTLEDVLRRQGPMPARQAVDHALDILEGLAAAHAAGILHRDLKPSNCFLDEHGRVRIGDFGLSKTVELDARITVEGSFLGTPAYASPEQVRGAAVDARADYYALGATLYALLTGQPPFGGRDLGSVLSRILTEEPPPPSSRGVAVPRGLDRVVLRLLAKDPARRPATAAAVRQALLPFSSRGLAPGDQPRRFVAFVADVWLLGLLNSCLGMLLFRPEAERLGWFVLSSWLVAFAYFFGFEATWARTPGKALIALRVTGAGGAPATVRQILVRTLVFASLYEGDNLLAFLVGVPGRGRVGAAQIAVGIAAVAMLASLLSTMRRRNGFAGLHELASGTRVQAVPVHETVGVPEAAVPPAAADASRRFGPYEEIAPLWTMAGESLILAGDPALKRRVFVHLLADPSRARPVPEVAAHAPGRLRWLQGRRGPAAAWDAYEVPGGSSLVDWVRARGRLEWREARGLLLGLARALAVAVREGAPTELSLHRVWADGVVGHVRLAPFPVASTDEFEAAVRLEDWRGFLRQALTFALEGRPLPPSRAAEIPQAVFAEHARDLLRRLFGPGPETPEALARELESLGRRPASVSRRQRWLALAVPVALPVAVVTVTVALLSLLGIDRVARGVAEIEDRVSVVEALETAVDPAQRERREAERLVIAATYLGIKDRPVAEHALERLTDPRRRLVEAAARDYPSPTTEELRAALARAGPPGPRAMKAAQEPSIADPARRTGDLLRAWRYLALAAVVVAPLTGGGLGLLVAGLTVQRRDGRRAPLPLLQARAVLAWSPFLLAFLLDVPVLGAAGLVLSAASVVGVAWAAIDPRAGIADRLLGTRLTPR